jgi:hypothetical protein
MAYTKDPNWTEDLLWHYLHQTTSPPETQGTKWWFDNWYKSVDSTGALGNRREVYKLLVDNATHMNPTSGALRGTSAIPWNQNNKEFLKTCKAMKVSGKACGTIVKVFFQKYMKWLDRTAKSMLRLDKKGCDPSKVKNACDDIVKSLTLTKMPVRVGLGYGDSTVVSHFIGVVGCKAKDTFLCIEPWSGNCVTTYAGTRTGFLAVLKHNPTMGELKYQGMNYRVLTVEA